MRLVLTFLIGIHGIIHLFGFLKAFGITEFNAISQPISRTNGILWLLTFILFIVTTVMLIIQSNYWWTVGLIGVIISQFLIINYWSDAKFGTILNLIILVLIIVVYSTFNFGKIVNAETSRLIKNSDNSTSTVVVDSMIIELPNVVRKWLLNSGIMGKDQINSVYLEQDLQMLMKPNQKEWNKAKAQQYFTTDPPAFNWSVNLKMNSFLEVVGRDKFEDGKGEMIIKLLSLIPVANSKQNEKINQATLQRYLAEIVWFPSAALSPYITWKSIDEFSAKATMEYNGTKGSGTFYFDKDGNFEKFKAMRYQDSNAIDPIEWTVIATKIEERNGINIPVACEASWKLESGNWTWLKLKINHITYNAKPLL
jgi:hypothetical protein